MKRSILFACLMITAFSSHFQPAAQAAVGGAPQEGTTPFSQPRTISSLKLVSEEAASNDGAGRKIAPPSSLLGGAWSWTTISSINYQDTVTKQLAAPSGMSARFSFTKDGRYKYFFYVRQRTYNLVTESTTTEEGTVTFYDNGTMLLRPTKGHYKGSTGSRIIDRSMTASERKARTFYWEWRTDEDKRKLYIGPSQSSMSHFKRAE